MILPDLHVATACLSRIFGRLRACLIQKHTRRSDTMSNHLIATRLPLRRQRIREQRRRYFSQLIVETLEDRALMTVDLILDFDGGIMQSGDGYDIPETVFDEV